MNLNLLLLALVVSLTACNGDDGAWPREDMPKPSAAADGDIGFPAVRLETRHLSNSIRIHPKVISGALPEDDSAFAELADLGIRTIISVDGAAPDVQAARRHGLRYVHLPHGYDGIPDQRVKELAKAVRDLDGPIYIHCHHGRHRSPAAASVACVAAGLIAPSQAMPVLALAGTSKNYRGLYQSASHARKLEASILDQWEVEFRETVPVPPLADAMVQLEHTHDQLKLIANSNWQTPANHPDLDPAHVGLLLREHFTELLRTDEVQQQPAGFVEMLRQSESAAGQLERSLKEWREAENRGGVPSGLSNLAKRIEDNCMACHVQYRDVPLGEK